MTGTVKPYGGEILMSVQTAISQIATWQRYGGTVANGLGAYVKAWRLQHGVTQSERARRVDMPGPHLNQIESGKIALPSADVRRRLAIAMGVTHVDLLLAAGELSDADIQVAGIEGVAIDTPEIEDLVDDLRAVHLTNKRVRALKGVIALMRESDQHLLSDPANGLPVAQMTG